METILSDLATYWAEWAWPIILFVFGLGLMVFVHELGHFLVAKWVGIKVERFAIGLGPRVAGFKPGETDYCLCAVPLGGYVKMLGQEDFKPLEEGQQADPRSYQAKSVGQRFAVIAAGVVMNVILAAVLFVVVGLVGKGFPAPVIGAVSAGSPASQAPVTWTDPPPGCPAVTKGIEPGDRVPRIEGDSIVQWICGDEIEHFMDLKLISMVADPADTYTMTVERVIGGQTVTGQAPMKARMGSEGVLVFGVGAAPDLAFDAHPKWTIDTPFRKGDRLLRVAGREVSHYWDIAAVEETLTGEPITVTVRRDKAEVDIEVRPTLVSRDTVHPLADGTIIRGETVDVAVKEVPRTLPSGESKTARVREFTLEAADGSRRKLLADELDISPLRLLGMAPRMSIIGVLKDSPAGRLGLRPGDIVLSYGGMKLPTVGTLRDISKRLKGEPIELVVLHGGEEQTFTVEPEESDGVPRVGITSAADLDHAVVAEVQAGSPAAKAGIPAGARLTSVGGTDVASWPDVYGALSASAGETVRIAYEHAGRAGAAEVELTADAFRPDDCTWRLFVGAPPLKPLMVTIRQDGVLDSLAWGGKVSVKAVLSTYLSIRSLIRGWVPLDEARGPLGLGQLAVTVGRRGLMDFVYFLGLISVAIAVFNFLPIPVVDGGHAVLLLVEKVRGKALSLKVTNAIQVVGLVLILGLFLWVTWHDFMRMIS